ncbi:MAG: hypothetical protein ACU0GG_14705 [Paracoccaceae bacterium]
MSVGGLTRGLENLSQNEDSVAALAQSWPIFAVIGTIVLGVVLFKVGRKGMVATSLQPSDGELGARLAEIDLENYSLDGSAPAAPAPTANFDDFFSNADRRQELERETPAPGPDDDFWGTPVQRG